MCVHADGIMSDALLTAIVDNSTGHHGQDNSCSRPVRAVRFQKALQVVRTAVSMVINLAATSCMIHLLADTAHGWTPPADLLSMVPAVSNKLCTRCKASASADSARSRAHEMSGF